MTTTEDSANFETLWRRFHDDQHPIGWMMRRDGRPHWLRFHSLPSSKRCPETQEEWSILLERQNQLALEVLGEGPCWLVQPHFDLLPGEVLTGDPAEIYEATDRFDLRFAFRFEDMEDVEPDDPVSIWSVYAGRANWSLTQFENELRAIADDISRALWMSEVSGAVFAPYNGGVDLFLPDAAGVERLRARYADWLPVGGPL